MRIQPLLLLILLLCGALAQPAVAQQDERFYGRWEPSSTPAGGNIMWIDPGGTLSFLRPTGEYTVERYQVIRDFGKRLVVRIWNANENAPMDERDSLVILEYIDDDELTGHLAHYVTYHFCIDMEAHQYFFRDYDAGKIWRRILEWSARPPVDPTYEGCRISEDGEFSNNWSRMSWFRTLAGAEE